MECLCFYNASGMLSLNDDADLYHQLPNKLDSIHVYVDNIMQIFSQELGLAEILYIQHFLLVFTPAVRAHSCC